MLTLTWRSRLTGWSMTETVDPATVTLQMIADQCSALELDCEVG